MPLVFEIAVDLQQWALLETSVSQYGTTTNNRHIIYVELISTSFSFINYVNVPMIGRSFLIFWSRR